MTRRPPEDKLTIYRRHKGSCAVPATVVTKCDCPLWAHGRLNGKRTRISLDTRSLAAAEIAVDRLLNPPPEPPPTGGIRLVGADTAGDEERTVEQAFQAFAKTKNKRSPGTRKHYQRTVGLFIEFAEKHGVTLLKEISEEVVAAYLDAYGPSWSPDTKVQRLKLLRTFFRYCVNKRWLKTSPAGSDELRPEKRKRTPLRKPFTPAEIARIDAALDGIEDEAERIRCRALIYLLLYSGMRISDATFCERSYLKEDGTLDYVMIKTGRQIDLAPWLHPRAVAALKALPPSRVYFFLPDRADDYWNARHALITGDGKFEDNLPDKNFFSNARAKMSNMVLKVLRLAGLRRPWRIEAAANRGRKRLGFEGACHRFRDTFAINLLVGGTKIYTVSRMLGHKDVNVTSDHYLKLVPGYSEQLSRETQVLNYPLAG